MERRAFVGALGAVALGSRLAPVPAARPPVPRQRGICFDAYRSHATAEDFTRLRDLGVSCVALFPYARMNGLHDPSVARWAGPDDDPSLTDDGLRRQALLARAAGLNVMLAPTISDPVAGAWRGEVRMTDEAAWQTWFAEYGRFLDGAAALAASVGAVGLSIGTELRGTVHRRDEWARLIARVRDRFDGWLTYAANFNDYHLVPWWPQLDCVGVQAYFPLPVPDGTPADAVTSSLEAAWAPHAARLEQFARTVDRPVLFTEIGYKSAAGATAEPWLWRPGGAADPDLQAAAYEAAFRVFWNRPWFAGAFWWKWHPASASIPGADRAFPPQDKPAAEVLRRWYGGRGG